MISGGASRKGGRSALAAADGVDGDDVPSYSQMDVGDAAPSGPPISTSSSLPFVLSEDDKDEVDAGGDGGPHPPEAASRWMEGRTDRR